MPSQTTSSTSLGNPSTSSSASISKSTKKKQGITNFNRVLSESSIRYNDYLLEYCQTSMSALSGCAAGIIGLTGLYGFLFYFICSLFLSFVLLAYLGSNVKKYFLSKQTIVTGTLWSGIQTYLLFWTFLFGMVHVY
jgi:hypothetical protein